MHVITVAGKEKFTHNKPCFNLIKLVHYQTCNLTGVIKLDLTPLHICSSVVRAFAHGAMGHWINSSWWTH